MKHGLLPEPPQATHTFIPMNPNYARQVAVVGLLTLAAWPARAADLTGRVTSASAAPIAGATVFVYTAGPKTGTSPYCPSCYPDCGKTAKTDAGGSFAIKGLSDGLKFRLLVVAKDHQPTFLPGVDPAATAVDVTMKPRFNADAPPERTVRGHVVDAHGAQIYGAVVEVEGVDFGNGLRRWGAVEQSDPLAVTDESGEFVLTTKEAVAALLGRVTARGYASENIRLDLGKTVTLTVADGATLTGRVVRDGQPVPNVMVGVSAQDRAAGVYAGHFEVGTDANGRFVLSNLPAKTDYYLYGLMDTVSAHGAIPFRPVHAGRDGGTTDVGDVAIRAGYRLSGRVMLSDGGKLPPDMRLLVGRHEAWDSQTVSLGPDGEFDVSGLPLEVVNLTIRVPGYMISEKNRSFDPLNRRVMGKITGDVTGMELLLEPAAPFTGINLSAPRRAPSPPPGERLENLPLRGVEGR